MRKRGRSASLQGMPVSIPPPANKPRPRGRSRQMSISRCLVPNCKEDRLPPPSNPASSSSPSQSPTSSSPSPQLYCAKHHAMIKKLEQEESSSTGISALANLSVSLSRSRSGNSSGGTSPFLPPQAQSPLSPRFTATPPTLSRMSSAESLFRGPMSPSSREMTSLLASFASQASPTHLSLPQQAPSSGSVDDELMATPEDASGRLSQLTLMSEDKTWDPKDDEPLAFLVKKCSASWDAVSLFMNKPVEKCWQRWRYLQLKDNANAKQEQPPPMFGSMDTSPDVSSPPSIAQPVKVRLQPFSYSSSSALPPTPARAINTNIQPTPAVEMKKAVFVKNALGALSAKPVNTTAIPSINMSTYSSAALKSQSRQPWTSGSSHPRGARVVSTPAASPFFATSTLSSTNLPQGWKLVVRSNRKRAYVSADGRHQFSSLAKLRKFLDRNPEYARARIATAAPNTAASSSAWAAPAPAQAKTFPNVLSTLLNQSANGADDMEVERVAPPMSSSTAAKGPNARHSYGTRSKSNSTKPSSRFGSDFDTTNASSSSSLGVDRPEGQVALDRLRRELTSEPTVASNKWSSTVVFTHPACLQHDTFQGHVESPARLRNVLQKLSGGPFSGVSWRAPASIVPPEDLYDVHDKKYIRALFAIFGVVESGVFPHLVLDPPYNDTIVSAGTRQAALFSAGTVTAAVDAICGKPRKCRNCFCPVRPLGHHAERGTAMAHCLLNNIALGAYHAKRVHKLQRIAIVDFGARHGNGTQHLLQQDPGFFCVSVHRKDIFPFTGTAEEKGPFGNVLNIPVGGRDEFLAAIPKMKAALFQYQPQLIMVAAGFDGYVLDMPDHTLHLREEDFVQVSSMLTEMANCLSSCEGRLISVLEGGFNATELPKLCASHVLTLMGQQVTKTEPAAV